jgi:hypothetical protein
VRVVTDPPSSATMPTPTTNDGPISVTISGLSTSQGYYRFAFA